MQTQASHRLEELSVIAKEFVNLLRSPETAKEDAYAMLYYLRREVGYVVRTVGFDQPTPQALQKAERLAKAQLPTT